QFAAMLRDMGIERGDRVVICLPRGLDQYMAILGILWAGATYVPVDWAYPQDRIDFIIEDSGACLVVTESERAAAMPVLTLAIDARLGDLAAQPVIQ
ncbi:AMP-binding protein, partial [Acinetobacter baumannii]